jgi:O-acetyl-ADP-ribose deacetylase (regulator of RNase III)
VTIQGQHIHIDSGGGAGEAELLASCYTNSLRLASAQNLATVGFPAISTGVYRYPADQATAIAVHTVAQFLGQNDIIQKVVFIAFNENTAFIYRQALDILIKNSNT